MSRSNKLKRIAKELIIAVDKAERTYRGGINVSRLSRFLVKVRERELEELEKRVQRLEDELNWLNGFSDVLPDDDLISSDAKLFLQGRL